MKLVPTSAAATATEGTGIVCSPDQVLAVRNGAYQISLASLKTPKESLCTLYNGAPINDLDFGFLNNAGETRMLATSEDGGVRVFSVPLQLSESLPTSPALYMNIPGGEH